MSEHFAKAIYYWLARTGTSQSEITRTYGFTLDNWLKGHTNARIKSTEILIKALKIPIEEQDSFILLAQGRTPEQVKQHTGKDILYLPVKIR